MRHILKRYFFSITLLFSYTITAGGNVAIAQSEGTIPAPTGLAIVGMSQEPPLGSGCDCGVETDNPTQACIGRSVSYTREGETIGFEFNCDGRDCLCGRFANHWDFWVAPLSPGGNITITAMTPSPTGSGSSYRNGAQFGPTNMGSVNGFDGRYETNRFGTYDPTWSISVPLVHNPASYGRPEVIMKSIHETELANPKDRIYLRYVETLTLLDKAPGNVFRPAYFGNNKTMFSADVFNTSILSNVAPVRDSISWTQAYETVKSIHPQHYVENQNLRQGYTAKINVQTTDGYDGYYGLSLVQALLKLTEVANGDDAVLKDLTARGMTQLGIDLWAIHKEGGITNPTTGSYDFESANCGAFVARGGFNQNRLAPILFTSALLSQNWHEQINNKLETINGKNCFGETGYIQPVEVTQAGKNVPLFGNILGSHGIFSYTEGTNCNLIATNYLTDGGYGSCGSPTPYQECCTHGHWLGTAMAIYLTSSVYDKFPHNAMHWLTYIDRARNTGVSVGYEFGSYSNPHNFDITGFNTHYDRKMYYQFWDTYRECSKTQSCVGMQ